VSLEATKYLSLLLYPLNLSLLMALFALLLLLLSRKRASFWVITLSISWLYLCSTAFMANSLMAYLEQGYPSKAMSTVPTKPAIVLLGGAMRGYTHMGTLPDLNQQADRLVHATALIKAGKAPLMIVSGGAAPGEPSEASQIRELLLLMGVSDRSLVMEELSRNTHDNAIYTAQLLKERGIQEVLLVTSAFHMRRSVALFEAQGIDVVPAPTDYQRMAGTVVLPSGVPGVANLSRTSIAIHEIVGYWIYRWRGWL